MPRFPAHAALLGAVASTALALPAFAQKVPTADKSAKIAPGLYELVASESGKAVYVASTGSRDGASPKIFVLDPTTLAVQRTIDVASAPAFGLGINDRTQTLYTTNTRSGSVSAIDLRTGKVIATIKSPADTSAHLFRIIVDEASNTVYASVAANPGQVWVIDGKTNTLTRVIDSVGTRTVGLAVDGKANRLYAASMGTTEILAVDLGTGKVVQRMPAGGERPTHLALDTKTGHLFVTNQGSGDVTVLDTKSGQLLSTVKTGAGALGIVFNPTNNRVYVANRQAGTVTVIDAATYAVVANIPAGSLPNTVTVNTKTNVAYVTNKAKGAPRGQPPVDDPNGDTVTLIKP